MMIHTVFTFSGVSSQAAVLTMMNSLDTEIKQIVIDLCATATRTEGVFRKSGNMNTVNYKPYDTFGIHDKATRLKQCLNRMKEKLIGRQLAKKLMKLVDKENKAILKMLKSELLSIHLEILAFVVQLFRLIAENEEVTLMSPRSISLCMTPALFDVSVNKMKENRTYDLLEKMIRHPMEVIPYFEPFSQNLMRSVETKGSFALLSGEKEDKSEETGGRMVAEEVLQNYGNCIKELSQGLSMKSENELTVCWELACEEKISPVFTPMSEESATQSVVSIQSSSTFSSPLPESLKSSIEPSIVPRLPESLKSSTAPPLPESPKPSIVPPLPESPKPVLVPTADFPKLIENSGPESPEISEINDFPGSSGMSNLERIMKEIENFGGGRMSTDAFTLEFDGNGIPKMSRRETDVWFGVGTDGRKNFFETLVKLTNK